MNKTQIAIIMPVYNAAKFLEGSLKSILNQEVKNIKLVCINDKSKDNSLEILKEYAKLDDRIIVLNNDENLGAGLARNKGLDYVFENLDVEYIAFVDADDKVEPNTFSKTYTEAKFSNADIVNFNFLPSTYWEYKTEANAEPVVYEGNCVQVLFDYKEFYTFVLCWSKLYKAELLKNIRFSGQKFYEDGCFAYSVLPRAKKMVVLPDVLYYYNIENPESTCGKIDENVRLKEIFKTMKTTIEDWKNLNILNRFKDQFVSHILLYTSMVCPNAFVGDYANELKECLGVDVNDADYINGLPLETQEFIAKMTK